MHIVIMVNLLLKQRNLSFYSLTYLPTVLLLISPLSTQKTVQRFRSWPSTSLMSFWPKKTLKSRNYSRRTKVKKPPKNSPFCWLYDWWFLSYLTLFMTACAELWLSLEEHQYALELIMGRYRKQMLQLMMAKKELDTKPVLSLHEDHAKVH